MTEGLNSRKGRQIELLLNKDAIFDDRFDRVGARFKFAVPNGHLVGELSRPRESGFRSRV